MKDFFPGVKKSLGLVAIAVIGTIVAISVNKYFGIESKVPRSNMKKVG